MNAIWLTVVSGQNVTGSCITNYAGSPTRQCFQNGSIGVWDNIVSNPCTSNCYLVSSAHVFIILQNSKLIVLVVVCLSETIDFAFYPATPFNQVVNGTCIYNYYGSPVMQCVVNGFKGDWVSSNNSNPCERIF